MFNNKFNFTKLGSKLDKIALKSKNLISDGQELLSKYENIFDDDDESTQNAGKRRIRKTRKTYKSRTRKPRKSIKSKKSRRRNRSRKNRKSRKSRSRSRKVTKRYARNVASRRRARTLKKM